MNDTNRNLLVRLVTSLALLPLVLFLLYRGGYWTAGLLAVAAAICASEYYLITQKSLSPMAWLGMACAAAVPVLVTWRPEVGAAAGFWMVGGYFLATWIFHLLRGPLTEAPNASAHLVTGLLYASTGLGALAGLRGTPNGMEWVVCALTVTWLNDTSAYFAGRFLGRRKLYPAVSPNKTWEGFLGGMAGSVGGLFLARWVYFPQLTVLDCLALGLSCGVVGPMGDLGESMLKRGFGVKDSGKILPGHGGLLDRIDALLFNAPVVFLWVHYVRGLVT